MSKPIILCVDDDPDVLSAVVRDLRKEYGRNYRIMRADSGDSALELVRELESAGAPVALFLSDQRMPGMGGVEFLSRASEHYPKARRVLLTAYSDTEAAIAAINQSRVHYYLAKPWDPPQERLFPVLGDMLDEWRAEYRPGYGGVRVVGDRWSAGGHSGA
jgi:thioredoxin reductase (NADPH)